MIDLPRAPQVVIDCGANIGYASLMYANAYPDAKIIAVEPDATNCAMWHRNCDDYPNLKLLHAAVWPYSCKLEWENPAAPAWAFRMREVGGSEADQGVDSITIPEIMRRENIQWIDLLKLDIEGAERELFTQGVEEWLPRVRALACELHDRFKPGCAEALDRALSLIPHHRSIWGKYTVIHLQAANDDIQSAECHTVTS